MSLSKGTAQAIVPRRTDAGLTVSLSTDKIDGGSAGSTPPDRSLTAKPSSEAVHDLVAKGNVSRSNSMQDIQHVQHELKSAGELVFATDASNSPTLKGGNFLKLVEWMLASASPEERALQNFVLAYRQWKPPAELWRIVMDKFDAQKTADKSDFHRKRIGTFVLVWVDQCLDRDFFSRKGRGRLFNKLLTFLSRLAVSGQQQLSYRIKVAILRHRNAIIKLRADAKNITKEPPKKVKAKLMTFTLFDWEMVDVAQQLALIESELFSSVSSKELFNLAWKSAKAKTQSPNVGILVERFNNVSYWVATEILLMAPGKRAPAIQRCIDLAALCLDYGNYNSLMEILAGLNHVSVTRLKEEFNSLPPKHVQTLAELNATMENQHNYRVYREQLQSRKPPCIPYLGIFLRDMTFLEEGNRQFIDPKDISINYEKMQLIGDVLRDLHRSQRTCRYHFKKKDPLYKHLLACEFPMLDDENLYQQSTSFRAVGAAPP